MKKFLNPSLIRKVHVTLLILDPTKRYSANRSDLPLLSPEQERDQLHSLAADFVRRYGSSTSLLEEQDEDDVHIETGLKDVVWSVRIRSSREALYSLVSGREVPTDGDEDVIPPLLFRLNVAVSICLSLPVCSEICRHALFLTSRNFLKRLD